MIVVKKLMSFYEHPYLQVFHLALLTILCEINRYRRRSIGGPVFYDWESGFSYVNIYNIAMIVVLALIARDWIEVFLKLYKRFTLLEEEEDECDSAI